MHELLPAPDVVPSTGAVVLVYQGAVVSVSWGDVEVSIGVVSVAHGAVVSQVSLG